MGLKAKGISHKLKHAPPHSDEARSHHPFGRIPSLQHNGHELFESAAIVQYLDAVFSNHPLRPADVFGSARVTQFCSAVSDYIFNSVEHGVIKPRLKATEQKTSEDKIAQMLTEGVKKATEFLKALESCVDADGPFLLGKQLTWADLYLAPVLADLVATNERYIMDSVPKIQAWFARFRKEACFIETVDGTLAASL